MTLGEKLRHLRKSRSVSQKKLADALGVSQSTIAQYETDAREPDFKMMERIASYFGVAASSLMPSEDQTDSEFVQQVADSLHRNPKLGLLFDRTRYMSEDDLDAVLTVVKAISKERGDH